MDLAPIILPESRIGDVMLLVARCLRARITVDEYLKAEVFDRGGRGGGRLRCANEIMGAVITDGRFTEHDGIAGLHAGGVGVDGGGEFWLE